jgi:hypothetical protein
LTITLSKPVASPYRLSLYDDLGNRLAYWTPSTTTAFTAVVTPGNNQTRTYTVQVSQDTPSPGPPTVDVRSPQSVTVHNVGWNGSISLSADRTQTDANSPSATLTITLSKPVASPYRLSLYDDLGNRLAYWTPSTTTTFTAVVTPGNNQTRTYTVQVSQDTPSPGPPTVDVRSPQDVTISDQGWIGSLQLSATPDSVTPSQPNATLTLTLDRPLATPYRLSLYDDLGNRLAYWTPSTTTTFTVVVTPSLTATRTYSAYVSQDTPSLGPPSVDVRASASVTYTNGSISGQSVQEVDLDYLAGLLVSETDDEIVLEICDSPEATYFEESSVCDEGLAYLEAITNEGESRAAALGAAIGAAIGPSAAAGLGAYLILHHSTAPSPPQAVPQTPPPPPPDFSDPPPPQVIVTSPNRVQYLSQLYLDRAAREGRELSPADAQAGADQCDKLVRWAIQSSVQIPSASGDACANLPIFFPGSNPNLPGQISPTTQHDWDAITGANGADTSDPSWIQLNWVNQADRTKTPGYPLTWRSDDERCDAMPTGDQCDEYPYFSSAQGGPAWFAGPPGASLRPVIGSDNGSQGSKYRWFADWCDLKSGGSDQATAAAEGSPFLVIPIPSAKAPPTFSTCGA